MGKQSVRKVLLNEHNLQRNGAYEIFLKREFMRGDQRLTTVNRCLQFFKRAAGRIRGRRPASISAAWPAQIHEIIGKTARSFEELIQDLRVNGNDLYSGTGTLIGQIDGFMSEQSWPLSQAGYPEQSKRG
jgi:hypothetical protein